MSECIEEEGVLFPQTSKLIKLSACLPDDCNSVNDKVIIETKFNTVEGIIHWIDGKNIKVSYHAEDAGFPPCYQLEQCDVISIRCYNCCDDRYFELESCELSCDTISAALGESNPKLVGNIFLYFGDKNEPDCLYKWNGLNDICDPLNWLDTFGHLPAQFENLNEDQKCEFLTWLTTVFSGNGIAFNVNEYCEHIIVTVGDGESFGPTSFSFSYSGGTVTIDPNDGSGPKTANIIETGTAIPEEPYSWFFFVNTNTNGLMVNVNGEAKLIGFIDDPNPNTCTDLVNCILTNIENGELDPDQWAMPQVAGPTWLIGNVTYGEDSPTVVDFTTCTTGSTDLDDLVLNLNACEDNPDGWEWLNNGGVLTLCTPVGTHILTVAYGSPLAIINFAGVPTVAGEEGADLCLEFSECLKDRGLLEEYLADLIPATIEIAPVLIVDVSMALGSLSDYLIVDVITDADLPLDTKFVYLAVYNESGLGGPSRSTWYVANDTSGILAYKGCSTVVTNSGLSYPIESFANFKIQLRSDGTLAVNLTGTGLSAKTLKIYVTAYSK